MPTSITMYSTKWCADCRNAKRYLESQGISYEEIDIDHDETYARRVIDWSGGRRVIPTFEIICPTKRVILHNPPLSLLAQELGIL